MKKVFFLLIAAFIVGFVVFAISFWLLNVDFGNALGFGVAAGLAGVVVEFMKPYFRKRSNN